MNDFHLVPKGDEIDYMNLLTPEEQTVCLTRFSQRPAEWPAGMLEGVNEIMRKRKPGCSEDVINVIAEWMVKNREDEFRANLRRALHLPEDASDYAILALVETSYHFYLQNRPPEMALPGEALDVNTGGADD